jgi:hypothetical protein
MKKSVIFLVLYGIGILLFISIVSAATYEQNNELDLKVPCSNNGTICSNSATCEISIIDPNSDFLINNQSMTNNNNSIFSYYLNEDQIFILGDYRVVVFCSDGSFNGYTNFIYEITETGESAGNYRVAIYVIIILAWLLFIIGAYRTEYTFIALSGIIMLVFGVYVLINGIDNFNNTLTTAFGGIHALFGGYLMMRAGYEQYKNAF